MSTAATVHLVCGAPGSGKTLQLLARYRAVAQGTVGAALWLVPTYRHLEALRGRLVTEGGGGIGLHLFTFLDFADELVRCNDPAARPLPAVQRRLLVDALVADLHRRGDVSHFGRVVETRGFAEGMVALLEELKQNEVRPIDLARAAYRRGYGGGSVARVRRGMAINRKERECCRLYARYQRLLARHDLYDPEGRQWYARDLLRAGCRRPFDRLRAVFVDGFVDFTRTQHEILQALAGWVKELWITLPDEPDDEQRAELFTRPRLTRERLKSGLDSWGRFVTCPAGYKPAPQERADGQLPFAGVESDPSLPAGLVHLRQQLFRPLRRVEQSADADGLLCLEAPGLLGEARLVARQVKSLLLAGTPAEDVLVTTRDLTPYADLLREVFAEYGIPTDVEGTEPLLRGPAVATLLRALRLPDEDWPFAGVTALLRSTYFRPDWPDTQADPEVAAWAEVLLRLLGEPRGREAYLNAVRRWATDPPPGLEDEQAEESRRARTHELAVRCQAFLERFFRTWDGAPQSAPLAEHVAWVRRFADDLGLARTAEEAPRDAAFWRRFQEEIDGWLRLEHRIHTTAPALGRVEFLRRLAALASAAGLARTPRGPGRVRILSAELARTLDVPYLFLVGLGERGFPRLVAPDPIFDEQERQALCQAGLDFPCMDDLLPGEMLLFYQLVTRARRRLTVSYPAVDDKGQALLPSSFLHLLLQCFTPGAVPVERRNMLIEGYDRDEPLCPAEYRVQQAAARAPAPGLPPDLVANLTDAARVAAQRADRRAFTAYDGLLRDPAVVAAVAEQFGPDKVFSPTALEDYIACPYRFFLRHVLRLEPLEEPREEIEVTRRGQAFHRALSRLHRQLQDAGIHQPSAEVEERLRARLTEAVEEYAARAPSPASKVLWRLEGQRLLRCGNRYPGHWQDFVAPWRPAGILPRPWLFEVDFGLPGPDGAAVAGPLVLRRGASEVRVSGRIDRVDVAELDGGTGFWIIDYKTGRSQHYTAADLRAFRRLQLTLYALAVEQVLLADRRARPLGLAYWLVSETGPKVVLPGRTHLAWYEREAGWHEVREQLVSWVVTLAEHIRRGVFALQPRSEHCTQTCNFAQVCRISQARAVPRDPLLPLPGEGEAEGDADDP